MALPKNVKKQVDEANRIQKQLNEPPQTNEDASEDAEQPKKAESTAQDNQPPVQQNEPSYAAQEPADQDEYKKRFVNLKKKYDEVVPQLRNELADTQEAFRELKQQIQEMRAKPAEEVNEPAISQNDIDEYGEDLINLVGRVSKTELAKDLLDLKARLENLEQSTAQISNNQKVITTENFYDRLTTVVSNWREINKNPAFQAWLAEEVPYTGQERQQFLEEAHRKLDVQAVAQFFTDWQASQGSVANNQPPARTPSPDKVMPDNSRNTERVDVQERRIYTTKEISQFYRDKTKGRYVGREEEARRIELDILAAGKEGRVR